MELLTVGQSQNQIKMRKNNQEVKVGKPSFILENQKEMIERNMYKQIDKLYWANRGVDQKSEFHNWKGYRPFEVKLILSNNNKTKRPYGDFNK